MDVASQNCIIRGQLDDAFCLLCEQHLHTKRDLFEHVDNEPHQHNLLNSSYVDKYAGHKIRKIKAVYYCEFCSVVESVSIKVGLHVKEPCHIQRRGTAQLKREGDLVIAFDDIAITDRVWNSLADKTCMLCAIDFDEDLETHKNGAIHSLNLIKSKIEFGECNSIYRKVDSLCFHCLTCDELFNFDILKEHFNEDNHKEQYVQCRIFLQNTRAGNAIAIKTNEIDNNNHIDYMNEANTKEIDCYNQTVSCGSNLQVKELNDTQNDSVLNLHDEENTSNGSVALEHEKTLISFEANPEYADIKGPGNAEIDTNVTPDTIEQNEHVDTENKVVENEGNGSLAPENEKTLVSSEADPEYEVDIKENENIEIDTNVTPNTIERNEYNDTENTVVENKGNGSLALEGRKTLASSEANPSNTIEQNEHVNTENTVVVYKDKPRKEIKAHASDEDIRNFARENKITWNFDHKNAYCRSCCVRIPNSLKCLQEHVYGQKHKSGMKKTPRIEMITSSYVHELIVNWKDGVAFINSKLCITALSFLLMTVNGNDTIRCQLCEVNVHKIEIKTHSEMYKHRITLSNVPVILEENMESEFIREVRKNVYHCGYCNLLADWPTLRDHLNSVEHKNMKQKSSEEFERRLPDLQDLRRFRSLQRIRQFDPITYFLYLMFADKN